MDRKQHWETVYDTKQSTDVSWFQAVPTRSLELIAQAGVTAVSRIIDIGGGDALLVDALLDRGHEHVSVLDLSGAALRRAQARIGARASSVSWLEADVTTAALPTGAYDVWHDRAVFHFLTDPIDRARYISTTTNAVRVGGTVIVATFALDGPTRCSGLEVAQYSPQDIGDVFGDDFTLRRGFADVHTTPSGAQQRFSYAVLQRVLPDGTTRVTP
jgi:trans-aconitate methyltransferase